MLSVFKLFRKKKPADPTQAIIEKLIGYRTSDPELFVRALRHKSVYENAGENNERLEFLGDAIIDAVVSKMLFEKYPRETEGFLTKLRSRIVSRSQLNRIALAMKIDELIEMQIERRIEETSLSGNALEAIVGAVYVDRGFDFAEKFICEKIIKPYIDFEDIARSDPDPKSRIIEWAQKNKRTVVFDTIATEEEGLNRFSCRLLLDSKEVSKASGTSKKRAEQSAAAKVVDSITKTR